MTDPLTGALNRRSFSEHAQQARARSADSLECVAMLLLDVDHFKVINDVHGHAAGDATLQRIVEDCRKEIRSRDILGRFGGEEFAIFLPGCDVASAGEVAERICRRIAKPAGPEAVPCTVSIGVATSQTASDMVEGVLRRADAAMYVAKANRRNRNRRGRDAAASFSAAC